MPTPTIAGSREPIRQPTRIVFDPDRGLQTIERWECAGPGLGGVAAAYQGARVGFDWEISNARSVLIATASGGGTGGQPDTVTDTWQILANEIQKDIREHPKSLALGASVIRQINESIKNDTDPLKLQPPLSDDAKELHEILLRGGTHFALSQYVLKHTSSVANTYAKNIADINVNKLYTASQLFLETQNRNLWGFPLPGRLRYKMEAIESPTAAAKYLWSWRKLASTETTSANGRIDISTEYWLEQWSTWTYQLAVLS